MFDYVNHQPEQQPGRPRYMTAGVSAIMHVLVLAVAVGLPILYASDELPKPPDMMAFVMEAPPPPPPPPPPAPAAPEKKPDAAKPDRPALETAKPTPAAPIEAPSAVTPETGLESAASAKVEAGFEGGIAGGVVGGAVGGIETGAPAPPPPPAPPKPSGPIRVGGQIKAPQLVHRVNPTYPPVAQNAQVEGSVVVEATVDKTGRVQNVRVVRSQPLLDEAAMAAVRQWRYEPLNLNGEPTPFILTVTVSFTIPK